MSENKISLSLFGLEINANVDEMIDNYKKYKDEKEEKKEAKRRRKRDFELETIEKRNEIDFKYAEKCEQFNRKHKKKDNDDADGIE